MVASKKNKEEIYYRDRQTGKILTEKVLLKNAMRWFHGTVIGSIVFNVLLNHRFFGWLYGKVQNLPSSRNKINQLVEHYPIDLKEIEYPLSHYQNYNAFFSRRLKPDARTFSQDEYVLCSPGDGKIRVYPWLTEETRISVKGANITIGSLLNSDTEAQAYRNGSALILRLSPHDYHRFHFPDGGKAEQARYIKGKYYSVNPIALAQISNLYCRNKRAVTKFYSNNFGQISYIEVGAITVGDIVQTYNPGPVNKGQEKGFFQCGGSTLILLFEPGKITFDQDLIQDSHQNLEVRVLTGMRLGIKVLKSMPSCF
ncbi:MAG: archaetidylserine decarboxylase [Cyanobacteria bacterium P01_C01_bin.118]